MGERSPATPRRDVEELKVQVQRTRTAREALRSSMQDEPIYENLAEDPIFATFCPEDDDEYIILPKDDFAQDMRNGTNHEERTWTTRIFNAAQAGLRNASLLNERISSNESTASRQDTLRYGFTAYKRVGVKVKPISTTMPTSSKVRRTIPEDPMETLPPLPMHPPNFVPSGRLTAERLPILEINKEGYLLPEEEKLLTHIMNGNNAALAFEDVERGTFHDSYFSPYVIPTVPHRPWEFRNIPIPPGILHKVIDVLKLKIAAGVYEPSESSYRSKWFCVLKKNGKIRLVHDLQPLNGVTIRDAGMLPILDDFVEGFAGRQVYTVFDLFWGFDARKIDRSSREMTAFMTPLGLLQLTSLPTGFTNSPAEFQKSMVFVLQAEIPQVANIFIDDLAIKGPATQYLDGEGNPERLSENPGIRRFIWEHANDVHRILHKIWKSGATFSATKIQICRPEVMIVGQKCNSEGRSPDASKVEKILKWPQLENPTEVRQFLGLCGSVRIWIRDYSMKIRPLTQLSRKGVDFVWGKEQSEAFAQIKEAVTSAPAMKPINYESENWVVLSVDSSNVGTGLVLSQLDDNGRKVPARYSSIPMSEREGRYSQPKLELFGLYKALRHWRLYLIGVRNLRVEVDAKYIAGMLREPDIQPNATINRWIQGILLFDFELVHVPATRFKAPDALSRRPLAEDEENPSDDDSWLDNIALLTLLLKREGPAPRPSSMGAGRVLGYSPADLPSCYASRVMQEETLQKIRHFLTTLEAPYFPDPQAKARFLKLAKRYLVRDQRMFRKNDQGLPLLVVTDPQQKLRFLEYAHDKLGHKGVLAVYSNLKRRVFWPNLHADVRHHVSSCHECQLRSLRRMEKPLTVSTPSILFEKVYIDVMYMPSHRGFSYIVAARDDLTGVCEARALRAVTSQAVAAFLWEDIYCRYGVPRQIVTDNGSEVAGAFEELVQRLGVPRVKISPYNKHANGVVERGHFTLREALLKSCGKRIVDWPIRLPAAVFADRVTISKTTGYSPYQLLHATDPLLPFDLAEATFMVEGFHRNMSTVDLLAKRIQQLDKHPDDIQKAAQALKEHRFKSKAQFEKRFKHRLMKRDYAPGERVLLRNSRNDQGIGGKENPRYSGPFKVVRKTRGGAYRLQELDGSIGEIPYAAFRLLPYIDRNHPFLEERRRKKRD